MTETFTVFIIPQHGAGPMTTPSTISQRETQTSCACDTLKQSGIANKEPLDDGSNAYGGNITLRSQRINHLIPVL